MPRLVPKWLHNLAGGLTDGMPEFAAQISPPGLAEIEQCRADRCEAVERTAYSREDWSDKAAQAVYGNGKNKRKCYRRVNLAKRSVGIVLHQMGVERADASPRWWRTTGHRVITPAGRILVLHPLDVRLVAANALDRRPFHAISIEIAGNFEGVDGNGKWWKPDLFGAGRASEVQLAACRQEIAEIVAAVRVMGAEVEWIAPHRISGRDRRGKPNRPICPGSRVWIEAGERATLQHGLCVPRGGFQVGGLPVGEGWRGPHHGALRAMERP